MTRIKNDITPKGVVVRTEKIDGTYDTVVHPQPGEPATLFHSTTDRDEAKENHEKVHQLCLQEDYAPI